MTCSAHKCLPDGGEAELGPRQVSGTGEEKAAAVIVGMLRKRDAFIWILPVLVLLP